MACIEVEQLQKIRLHQDDVLVVKLDHDVDTSTQRLYSEILGRVFPDNKVVLLQAGQSLEVITNNSGAADNGPAATTPLTPKKGGCIAVYMPEL